MRPSRMYPVCNALEKGFVRWTAITNLILVHILIVNLKRMRWQLLCFVQFPIKERGKEQGDIVNMWISDSEIY